MKRDPKPAQVLPKAAVALLQSAAETAPRGTNGILRIAAIEKATAQIKAQYPKFFRQEP